MVVYHEAAKLAQLSLHQGQFFQAPPEEWYVSLAGFLISFAVVGCVGARFFKIYFWDQDGLTRLGKVLETMRDADTMQGPSWLYSVTHCPSWLVPKYGCGWLTFLFKGATWLIIADALLVLGIGVLWVHFMGSLAHGYALPPDVQETIEFQRKVAVSNGVSPLLPTVFLCAALFTWGVFLVKKLYLASRFAIPCPFPVGKYRLTGQSLNDLRKAHLPDNVLSTLNVMEWREAETKDQFVQDLGYKLNKQDLTRYADTISNHAEVGLKQFLDLRALDRDIRSELMPPSTLQKHPAMCGLVLFLLIIVFWTFYAHANPAFDGKGFQIACLMGVFIGSFLLVFTLLQFYFASKKLGKMLRLIALLPLAAAFDRLPEKVVSVFGHYLSSLKPRFSHLAVPVHLFGVLKERFPPFRAALDQAIEKPALSGALEADRLRQLVHALDMEFPGGQVEPVGEAFQRDLNVTSEDGDAPSPLPPPEGEATAAHIHQMVEHCLKVLQYVMPAHSVDEAFGRHVVPDKGVAAPATYLGLEEDSIIRQWIMRAEDFVAIEIIRYISQFTVQLRNLLTSLTVGSVLLLLAVAAYPFHPQQLLLMFLTVLGGAVGIAIIVFLVQINRDELVSRITRGTPNRFTPDLAFVNSLGTYVLPIVGGLMLQFPFFATGVRSLLEPLFHVVK
jgi:hypothetical protein